jgi:hypothetical protein
MVFQIEVDGAHLRPVYAGEGARRLFGLTPADLADNPGAWLSRLTREDVDQLRTRLLVATAGVTSFDWDASLPQPNAPARHGIDQVIVMPADAEAGIPQRFIEFTSRARRVGNTRVLWDGIATMAHLPQREPGFRTAGSWAVAAIDGAFVPPVLAQLDPREPPAEPLELVMPPCGRVVVILKSADARALPDNWVYLTASVPQALEGGRFVRGKREGEWTLYDASGAKKSTVRYAAGLEVRP